MSEWNIQITSWHVAQNKLRIVREAVFIREQQVPESLEWDEADDTAIHFLCINSEGTPIACARLVGDQVGRMAVIKPWRGKGIGSTLLREVLDFCRQSSIKMVKLSAQKHAISFYQLAGFEITSGEYLDAGILHVDMQLVL